MVTTLRKDSTQKTRASRPAFGLLERFEAGELFDPHPVRSIWTNGAQLRSWSSEYSIRLRGQREPKPLFAPIQRWQ